MDVGDILVALIGGTVIGLLGTWAAPSGPDRVPLWLTILCGIGGAVLGTYLYAMFFDPSTVGVDWWRHAWQVAVAAVLVTVAAGLTGRDPRARG